MHIPLLPFIGWGAYLAIGAMADVATPYPNGVYEKQPDGSEALVFLRGHPHHGVFQTDQLGHPILRDQDGWLVYASQDDTTVSPTSRRRHLIPSDRVVGFHDPPYNKPPDLRELYQEHSFNANPTDTYRSLLSRVGKKTKATAESQVEQLNDMLCDGMPRSQWCPDNPIDIKTLGRNVIKTNDMIGELDLIVILVKFNDQANRHVLPASNYEQFFNDPTHGPTGSVAKFFERNSGGKFAIRAHVEDWTVSPNSEEYWSFGRFGLTRRFAAVAIEGLNAMDRRGTDWSKYDRDGDGVIDGIFIIHSGFPAEIGGTDSLTKKPWGPHRIWSHRASVGSSEAWTSTDKSIRSGTYATSSAYAGLNNQQITRIGVVVHEMGHMLGLPDMLPSGEGGNGVGFYDVMGNMWGPDGTQFYPGLLSAWSRVKLGWARPTELTKPGVYQISAAINDPNAVYRITHGFPEGEYLLIENRIRKDYDQNINGEGLLIWHIDETMDGKFMQLPGYPGQPGWPTNGNHYQVALLQADQVYGLERGLDSGNAADLYKAGMADLGPGSSGGGQGTTIYPNTDSYLNGNVQSTGVTLGGFSNPGDVMVFSFSIEGAENTNYTTLSPSRQPTTTPTLPPTRFPTYPPTTTPTKRPTLPPTQYPTHPPTQHPTKRPTLPPTQYPTHPPTQHPTKRPTLPPTQYPTHPPTQHPTKRPTLPPTQYPTHPPTQHPTKNPTLPPTEYRPTQTPTSRPVLARLSPPVGENETDDMWWERVSSALEGSNPPLKRCNKRHEIPANGTSCSRNSKICFFGTKVCRGVGFNPAVQCNCEGQRWKCNEAICYK